VDARDKRGHDDVKNIRPLVIFISAVFETRKTAMRRIGTHFFYLLAALWACALAPRDAHAADKVTFVTDFGYNGRHAYYFVALDKGYYAKHNLDVAIVRGQGSADAVKQVAAGTAQIGFCRHGCGHPGPRQ